MNAPLADEKRVVRGDIDRAWCSEHGMSWNPRCDVCTEARRIEDARYERFAHHAENKNGA